MPSLKDAPRPPEPCNMMIAMRTIIILGNRCKTVTYKLYVTVLHQAKHNRFHAGPPAWIERKFTFLLRLFKLKMSEYTLKIGICRN